MNFLINLLDCVPCIIKQYNCFSATALHMIESAISNIGLSDKTSELIIDHGRV